MLTNQQNVPRVIFMQITAAINELFLLYLR